MGDNHQKYPAYGGRGPIIVGVGLALGSITTMLLLLRLYVRFAITPHGGWALAWAGCAWVSATTLTANRLVLPSKRFHSRETHQAFR